MTDDHATPRPPAGEGRGRGIAQALSSRDWDRLTDAVLARIEKQVVSELDRRGRRTTPRVY